MLMTIMQNKNYYSHCPLKKRPVFIVREETVDDLKPENLSIKEERQTSNDLPDSNILPKPFLMDFIKAWSNPIVPSPYFSYLNFPPYSIPFPNEPCNYLYYQQFTSIRDSDSVSPPAPVFIEPSYNKYFKSEKVSQRFMPYNRNLLPLSPTSPSHSSFISFTSPLNTSVRCASPLSLPLKSESSLTSYNVSKMLEESTTDKVNCLKAENTEKAHKAPSSRYKCPDCGKSYSTYSGLSKHQQFHCAANEGNRVKKTVSCDECGKVYASTGALKMHIRTHTLPCKCHLCGKAFSRPWLLQGHIRTHTGEKPFSCTHCDRAFADRSNLRAHLQTHSDVKKYSCMLCKKTFSRMSLLIKHNSTGCSKI